MFPIKALVPHSGKMLLLDEVIDYGEHWLSAKVIITNESMFCDNGAVPALVGIEYMAQSIAAFAGKNDILNNKSISIGLLLGTRSYDSNVSEFPIGTELTIQVEQIYAENMGLGVFKCKISADKISIEANINVYHAKEI